MATSAPQPGETGQTGDGTVLRPCPVCGGQVYLKARPVGHSSASLSGWLIRLTALCDGCKRQATRGLPMLPPSGLPSEDQIAAALEQLARTEPPAGH
jgi:cytochrome c5